MEKADNLFCGFAPVNKEDWKAKALEDLKGADYDRKLVWKSDEGFPVQPYYTREDVDGSDAFSAQDRLCARSNRVWVRYAAVAVSDPAEANRQAIELLKLGATGLLFTFTDTEEPNFPVLLRGLDPTELPISFASPTPSVALMSEYLTYLSDQYICVECVKGFYASDVLERWITTGEEPDFDTVANLVQLAEFTPEFKTLVVQSHAFVNAGASTTQELGFALNKLTDYVDHLSECGVSKDLITRNLMLHLAVGGDYFFEIAKLRAVRVLLKSILDLYGSEEDTIPILTSNALWSKSFYDPYVNMLRNTTEAMSAVLGGCDALLVEPHDSSYAPASPFSQRIALNTSTLLKEEAYFDKVVDPAAGCYYIEWLTAQEADSVLTLFKKVEAMGGFMEAFRSGMVQERIRVVREKKESEIASRKRVYVGTNKYPNAQEESLVPQTGEDKAGGNAFPLLVAQRATQQFEELRSRTLVQEQATGYTPRVYLATFGSLTMRKARASFASEFFGVAGFVIMGEFFCDDPVKAAEDSAASEADIVVLCSSDADYEDEAMNFVQAFRAKTKEKLLAVAGYPEPLVEALKSEGVNCFIHVKSNAIKVHAEIQNKLFTAVTKNTTA